MGDEVKAEAVETETIEKSEEIEENTEVEAQAETEVEEIEKSEEATEAKETSHNYEKKTSKRWKAFILQWIKQKLNFTTKPLKKLGENVEAIEKSEETTEVEEMTKSEETEVETEEMKKAEEVQLEEMKKAEEKIKEVETEN